MQESQQRKPRFYNYYRYIFTVKLTNKFQKRTVVEHIMLYYNYNMAIVNRRKIIIVVIFFNLKLLYTYIKIYNDYLFAYQCLIIRYCVNISK